MRTFLFMTTSIVVFFLALGVSVQDYAPRYVAFLALGSPFITIYILNFLFPISNSTDTSWIYSYDYGNHPKTPRNAPDPIDNLNYQTAAFEGFFIDPHQDLNQFVTTLIFKSWDGHNRGGSHIFRPRDRAISADELSNFTSDFLFHLRDTCPRLDVPRLTPKIVFDRLYDAAGSFHEDDGWVKITIDFPYINRPAAAKSILCHEICHYILGHNGISFEDTLENERLTETAMFVFGLGEIFMNGYKIVLRDYSTMQIGYLSDNEYRYLKELTTNLWNHSCFGPTNLQLLMIKLKNVVPDSRARERYIKYERSRNPEWSQEQIIESIIEKIAKDNR